MSFLWGGVPLKNKLFAEARFCMSMRYISHFSFIKLPLAVFLLHVNRREGKRWSPLEDVCQPNDWANREKKIGIAKRKIGFF